MFYDYSNLKVLGLAVGKKKKKNSKGKGNRGIYWFKSGSIHSNQQALILPAFCHLVDKVIIPSLYVSNEMCNPFMQPINLFFSFWFKHFNH